MHFTRKIVPNSVGSASSEPASAGERTVARCARSTISKHCVPPAEAGGYCILPPNEAIVNLTLPAAARGLHFLDEAPEGDRELVNRVNHADLKRGGRLARRACAVVAGTAASSIVIVDEMAAGTGIFTKLHRFPPPSRP